jgi:hypothetical protein
VLSRDGRAQPLGRMIADEEVIPERAMAQMDLTAD